jgi:hypothetical protein
MLNVTIAFIINWIHYLIILIGGFGWAFLPTNYLTLFIILLICIPIHWKIFGGCIITRIERHLLGDFDPNINFIEYELKKLGLPLDPDFVMYIVIYWIFLSCIFAFHRKINCNFFRAPIL